MEPVELLLIGLKAASLGYRTHKDNQMVDAEIMAAAKSQDPKGALNRLIESYDDELESELQRSLRLRGVIQ